LIHDRSQRSSECNEWVQTYTVTDGLIIDMVEFNIACPSHDAMNQQPLRRQGSEQLDRSWAARITDESAPLPEGLARGEWQQAPVGQCRGAAE
jgi:hypothetical protein